MARETLNLQAEQVLQIRSFRTNINFLLSFMKEKDYVKEPVFMPVRPADFTRMLMDET